MNQFKQYSVKVQQEQSSHSLVQINSAEGNFSTSESIFSKNNINNIVQGQSSNLDEKLIQKPTTVQNKSQKQQNNIKPTVQQQSNRLFTFMDEKESQKRVIYNFMNRHKLSHNQESFAFFKGKQDVPIQAMIQKSRQKRQQFLKKILNLNTNKSNKQMKKCDRASKSKTSKNSYHLQSTLQNVRPRSKTPKQEVNRSITPKYDKIIRVKSSLEKDFITFGQSKKQLLPKASKKYLQQRKQNNKSNLTISYEQNKEIMDQRSVKALIKQKKQLQKKLSQINQSLLNINKIKTGKKNPIKMTSRANGKKSKAKLLLL